MVSKVLIQYWNVSFLYTMSVLYRVFRPSSLGSDGLRGRLSGGRPVPQPKGGPTVNTTSITFSFILYLSSTFYLLHNLHNSMFEETN